MSEIQNITVVAILPDGNGSYTPCPEVLTEDEAIRYLRLDSQKNTDPANTLRNYRDKGKLKATFIGKNLLYSRKELDRFVEVLTNKL